MMKIFRIKKNVQNLFMTLPVEHALFKGTARHSAQEINGYLEKLGGELNAYTTKEEIVLHSTVLSEDLRKAADLLFELATEPLFPDGEVQKEKTVILEEIASYKDSPADDIYDRFESMLFEGLRFDYYFDSFFLNRGVIILS